MLRQLFAASSDAFPSRTLLVSGYLLAGLSIASPVWAAAPEGSYRGHAYGTFASSDAGPVAATLGRSAFQPCGCRGTNGQVFQNRIASMSAGQNGKVLRLDGVVTTVFTDELANKAVVTNTSRVERPSLFDGRISADRIRAGANVVATIADIDTDADGTRYVGLRIDGRPIGDGVAPNTTFALPGIGSVIVKRVKRGGGANFKIITVEALVVKVEEENDFDLPIGVEIIVGHATAGFSRTVPEVVFGGSAYAATGNAKVGDRLANQIGRAANIYVGCEGTNGKTKSNNITELDVGKVLSFGSGRTTAFGGNTPGGKVSKTTAKVEDVSLLNGAVTANAVTAVAQEKMKNGVKTRSTQGSGFVGLRVNGVSQPLQTPPNTVIPLPLFGRVVLNEQTIPPAGSNEPTDVIGIVIIITKPNSLKLPVGSRIIVAHARARTLRFDDEPIEPSQGELSVAEATN